jgi:hypothetical protein
MNDPWARRRQATNGPFGIAHRRSKLDGHHRLVPSLHVSIRVVFSVRARLRKVVLELEARRMRARCPLLPATALRYS